MKLLIIFVAVIAMALSAPVADDEAEILKLESKIEPEGYAFVSETSDGTSRREEGVVTDIGVPYPAVIVHGAYSWIDQADGKLYTVNYVADEYGFHPSGDHIPALPNSGH